MDEKKKDGLTGAAAGAAVGAIGGPIGATLGALAGYAFGSDESAHKETTRKTFYALKEAAPEANIYVDHVDPDGHAGSTRGAIDGLSHHPDIVLTGPPGRPNLIIEVETANGIGDDAEHAISQIEEFRVQGYKRVLVVPEKQLEDVFEWVEECEDQGLITGNLTLASPERVSKLL